MPSVEAAAESRRAPTQRESPPGTWARAAGQAAHAYACPNLMPEAAVCSYPVPAPGPSGMGLLVMLYLVRPNDRIQDDEIYEPQLAIALDALTLEVQEFRWLREPLQGNEQPLTRWRSPSLRAMEPGRIQELEAELLALYDAIIPLSFAPPEEAASSSPLKSRFYELFSLLLPPELMPYFEWLSPQFFEWLRSPSGSP